MKQKDVALIIIIVAISGLLSFFAANFLLLSSSKKNVKAEVVAPITNEFNRPSTKYFNENSINPTQQIQIGSSANTAPFTGQ